MIMSIESGATFMYSGVEYKISYIDEKKKRINVEPNDPLEKTLPLILNEIVKINENTFIVTYINEGKKRISLQLIEKGV